MKHGAQIATLSAQRLAYGSMPLELAESRPRSNFPQSRTEIILAKPHLNKTSRTFQRHAKNHTITHFRCTGSGLHSNLNSQQTTGFSQSDKQQDFARN